MLLQKSGIDPATHGLGVQTAVEPPVPLAAGGRDRVATAVTGPRISPAARAFVRTTTYVSPWSSALATLKPERTNVNAPFASGPHGVQSVLTCRPARAGPIRSSAEVPRLLNRLRCMLHVTVAAGASSVSSPLKVPWGR